MKNIFTVIMLLTVNLTLLSVPPVPEKIETASPYSIYPSEIFGPKNSTLRARNFPDSILVLRAQFSDVTFDLSGEQPTHYVPHDQSYFERWMFHLSSYYQDASHGNYHLTEENYTVWEQVYTLPETMAYYGDDDERTKRIAEFTKTVFELADADIDFSQYDSFIIFHAGAGQEADLSGNNEDALWSTFVTRRTLQAGLDPENDDYPGIQTNEGIIKEVVIVPESQWHPDSIDGETAVYGILGVFAHLFGHQLGLPTLYDNYSGDGVSYGIGNFGLMGTGLWNAKGFVPPLPCAWSRYYLGWENDNIIEISSNTLSQNLSYPMANDSQPKLYKIKISEKEYFLLENRQYNPDNSVIITIEETTDDTIRSPNFTFELLPPGEQDYYPPPNENVPRFNFMENTYLGCEWDFFLPGPGYSDPPGADNLTVDGSGIFIWHIDENIIEQKFSPDFEYNFVNSDASHKGVDLEEADGIQHLDAPIDQNSLGSPYDSFRSGNNDYFGALYYPGTSNIWLPTAESYYGGIPLEIKDISTSANTMSFSVLYDWELQAPNYEWENPFPAIVLDMDDDEENEIIYPMPNGNITVWKNYEIYETEIQQLEQPLSFLYSYDEKNNAFFFPTHTGFSKIANLKIVEKNFDNQLHSGIFNNRKWAAPILINPDHDSQAFLPLNLQDETTAEIRVFEFFQEAEVLAFPNTIACNMMYDNSNLYVVTKDDNYHISTISTTDFSITEAVLLEDLSAEQNINHAVLADWNQDNSPNYIFTVNDSLVYAYHSNGIVMDGFPVNTELYVSGIPSLADIDGNGYLDVLIGGENTFAGVNHLGAIVKPAQTVPASDSLYIASGVIALDLDDDGKPEILGNMSKNRFCVWENVGNNDFHLSGNYTKSLRERSRNYPQIVSDNNQYYALISADEGMIFRQLLGINQYPTGWITEYATHGRIASYQFSLPQNQFTTGKLFIEEHTFIYPNPYSPVNNQSIYQGHIRPNTITVKFMLSQNTNIEIAIFDVAGNKIWEAREEVEAYMQSEVGFNVKNIASGMYFALLQADDKTKILKFAIEK